jgi:hypothetical protein
VRTGRAKVPARGLSGSFREVAQALVYVAALMRIDARIARGERFDDWGKDDRESFYRACWRIYEACVDADERQAFEELTGIAWGQFAGALDALGWAIFCKSDRRGRRRSGAMVTPREVLGHA